MPVAIKLLCYLIPTLCILLHNTNVCHYRTPILKLSDKTNPFMKFFVLYLTNFFFRVQKLKFHGEDQSVLGDTLLRFAAIGIFAYSTFNIVVGALSVHRDPKNLLILATGGISIIQVCINATILYTNHATFHKYMI